MPSQNRFTQSGYWCRWSGLSSVCTHMDGNCIALRLCAMERREGKGVSQEVCLNISKYFRGKPPSASIVYHTPALLSRVYSVFFENFFERDLSRSAAPLHPSASRSFSAPLIPLSRASVTSPWTSPPPLINNDGDPSWSPPLFVHPPAPFSQPQLKASLPPSLPSSRWSESPFFDWPSLPPKRRKKSPATPQPQRKFN